MDVKSLFGTSLEADLRISMAWDTNDTDQDLHVSEPNAVAEYEEEVSYRRKLSRQVRTHTYTQYTRILTVLSCTDTD